jgi:hypothetical protein
MSLRSPAIFSILLLAATASTGHAAELGEAQVLSHIGQALVADVELGLIEDGANPVRVRLANPDVYRGANIAMPAVLSSLNMTVMRQGGRQFLHLTSLKPVESRHLHLYLELLDGAQRNVRLVTLWLTSDPNPAPPPVRETMPEAPKASAAPVPAPAMRKPMPPARPAAALQAGEEYVEPAPVRRKPAPKPVPVARAVAVRTPAPAQATHADAPSCAPQPSTDHLNACLALGEKNAALRHDLGKLEEKVKALQGAKAAPAAAPEVAHLAQPVPAAKEAVKEAPRIHRKPKKVEPPAPDTPWLAIGAGFGAVLAVAALVLVLLRRRKRSSFGKIPAAHKPAKLPKAAKAAPAAGESEPKPHFMAAVKARLMPGRGKEAAPDAAEPVLTDVIPQQE